MKTELSAPPVDPIWWYACLYRVDCTKLHVRIKTRLWIDAMRLAAEALGVSDTSQIYLIHEGETAYEALYETDETDERLK